MGVVRDVTIDQLTQAVHGISTSGMSDSTGQAIVTSINNLRSATSPIITDDTGQDINTTLQSLVDTITLRVDDLAKLTATKQVYISLDTVPANSYITQSYTVPSDRLPYTRTIKGYSIASSAELSILQLFFDVSYNNIITLRVRNLSASAVSGATLVVYFN